MFVHQFYQTIRTIQLTELVSALYKTGCNEFYSCSRTRAVARDFHERRPGRDLHVYVLLSAMPRAERVYAIEYFCTYE
jgi:hypothetical protein